MVGFFDVGSSLRDRSLDVAQVNLSDYDAMRCYLDARGTLVPAVEGHGFELRTRRKDLAMRRKEFGGVIELWGSKSQSLTRGESQGGRHLGWNWQRMWTRYWKRPRHSGLLAGGIVRESNG